ncbi:MAG TPA: quinolinate synthase NadA [Bacteriovoracaceae bacterium]|nr:quinolinate synthase NadA [Bacteriovoracaceae bacterium]
MIDIYEELENKDHLPAISEKELSDDEVLVELKKIKEELKDRVVVLGHHYQQDDVIAFADVTGDSLELARKAAEIKNAEYIIFCGVHFMAETADMLTGPNQKVILPDLRAGCSMADMANRREIDVAWKYLTESTTDKIVPITYINCSAALKSFVGENNGSICTSSNAEKVITWGLNQGEKLLFFPDQHLGRNTCFKLGIPLEDMVVYDPRLRFGGLTPEQIQKAKVILWYGFCSVHQGFNSEHIKMWRAKDPERKIIVHPECSFEVVQGSDLAGSTSYIINQIKAAPKGTKFAVGTEINLVNRLAQAFPELDITSLSPYQCLCTTMYRVRPRWLLESFRAIKNNSPINIISVDDQTKKFALKALDQMLAIS